MACHTTHPAERGGSCKRLLGNTRLPRALATAVYWRSALVLLEFPKTF